MDLSQWSTNRLLNTAARLSENTETNHVRSLGITHAGLAVLQVLSEQHAMSHLELAQKVRVRPETLGRVMDRLERGGLIVRSGSGADEKNVRVLITGSGRNVLERAYALQEEQERTLGSDEQLRAELIGRIRAHGFNADSRPSLKLVPTGDQQEGGGASRSSAAG